jgi:hypothetical protein
MKILKALSAISLVISSSVVFAQEAKVIVGLELGTSAIAVDKDVAVFNDEFEQGGLTFGYIFGYRWDNNVVVEGNYNYTSNDGLFRTFDHYEAKETKVMLGYSFEVSEYFRVIPMLGMTRWEVDTKEGLLLNPGPEDQYRFNGTDLTYKLRLDAPVGDRFVFSLSYARSEFDIGSMGLTQFAIKLEI